MKPKWNQMRTKFECDFLYVGHLWILIVLHNLYVFFFLLNNNLYVWEVSLWSGYNLMTFYLFIYNFSWSFFIRFQKNVYNFMRFWPICQVVNLSPIIKSEYVLIVHFSIFNFFPTHSEDDLIKLIIIIIIIIFVCIKAELKIMIITITRTKNLHRISKTFPGDPIHMSTHLPWFWTWLKLEINGNLRN